MQLSVTLLTEEKLHIHGTYIYIKEDVSGQARVLVDGEWVPIKENYPNIAYILRHQS